MKWLDWANSGTEDVVWAQMGRYWVGTGQLPVSAVEAWEHTGRDEYGFYELGTAAAYGPDSLGGSWSWPGEANWAGVDHLADMTWQGSPDPMAVAW